jgi:hypothetical protein
MCDTVAIEDLLLAEMVPIEFADDTAVREQEVVELEDEQTAF